MLCGCSSNHINTDHTPQKTIYQTDTIDVSVFQTYSGMTNTWAKYIALTFDDGPHKKYTPELLDILEKYNVHATFFVVGQNIPGKEWILKRMQNEWHEIGSHSLQHRAYTEMWSGELIRDRDTTEKLIHDATWQFPSIYRPPYWLTNSGIQNILERPAILWNVDPDDWRYRNIDHTIKTITKNTKENSIILMHDIYPASIKAVPTIIENLENEWYTFVTVSELLYHNEQLLWGTGTCMSWRECHFYK